MIGRPILLLIAAGSAALAGAQDKVPVDPSPAGVQKARSWEVSLGYAHDYTGVDREKIYYRLAYQGTKLFERGSLPILARPGSSYLRDPSDVSDFDLKLSLIDGVGGLDGPLAEAFGIRPFAFGGDFFRFFRGKVQVSTKLLNDPQYNVGVGLESINVLSLAPTLRDLRIPGVGDPAKVLRIGILGEKQSRERGNDDVKSTDTLVATYRGYAALGFDYHQTRDAGQVRQNLLAQIQRYGADDLAGLRAEFENADPGAKAALETDPVYLTALFLITSEIPATPSHPATVGPSDLDRFFARPPEQVRKDLLDNLKAYTDQRRQPRVNVEARFEGSYAALDYDVRRYNALYSFGLNLWLDPTRPDDGKLSLTYQHGYSRGAPTTSLDGLVATFGFRF